MANPVTETVELQTPLKLGDKDITTLTIRKPVTGELRGLSLASVLNCDVDTLTVLLPRITQPTITKEHVGTLDLLDIGEIAGVVVGFFQPPEKKG